MNTSMRIIIGAALLALAVPTVAQVTPDPAPDRFDAADTNDDNRVDRAEYDGFVAELVLLYDADRDGKLTRTETVDARDPSKFDVAALSQAAEGFSGAEIEQAIVAALYTAFADERELSTELLLSEVAQTRPLSVTARERVEELRAWAVDRTVPAD